jgi:uncharacterized repeat protein (TIGR01451 family)
MKLLRNNSLGRALLLTLLPGTLLFGQCTGSSTSSTCTSTGATTNLTSTPSTGGGDFPQPASIFPINNTVSGMTGTITSISVRLNGLSHTDPDDLDMMLVSPDGTAFVFWSDIGGIRTTFDQTQPPAAPGGTNVCRTQTAAGGACSISNFTITVADNGSTRLPDARVFAGGDTRVLVNNTTYQPANGGSTNDDFFNLNPAFNSGVSLTLANYAQNTTSTGASEIGGTGTFANRFNGSSNMNGVWKLYIVMDACCFTDAASVVHNDVGSLVSWSLIITTASNNAATTTSLVSNINPSLLPNNNNVTFTATVTAGGNPVTLGTVDFFNAGIPIVTGVAPNASGQASTTVTNLTERIHAISAVYSGATGFATSTGTLSQTVNRASTRTGNTFCNTGPIAIPATFSPSPASTPYPSNLFVTGLTGNISKVTLSLNNFNMTAPSDADVLLVGPGGQKFIPFSYIGGTTLAAANVNITLDDAAANQLPSTGGVTSGTYKPTVHNTFQVSFPSPAPAGPHTTAAPNGTATFANTFGTLNPIGTWQLFVSTHGGTNATSNFNGGWCLTFTTSGDPASTTTPSVNPSPSAVDQNVTVSALVTNATTGSPVTQGSVSFFENSTLLGGGPLALTSNGIASFSSSAFTQGAHYFDANYSGFPGAFNLSTGRVLHYVDAPTTNPSAGQFCNTSLVTFPDVIGASGNPYPTRVNVSGLAGTLSKVTLTLTNLSHNFTRDMDMMLSGPNGNSLVVLSDVGGTSPLTSPITLVLDSTASTSLPSASALSSGTFLPTDINSGPDTFAPPAPTTNVFSASSTTLDTAFDNSNPNGIWTLWTTNDGAGSTGGGSLAGGWCLNLTMTRPQLSISKTHVGNFSQGQTGAQYTVVVGSNGPGSTSGTISVVDTPPPGLTITGMSGSGWTCTLNNLTCTTSAVLPANGTLPPITVAVNVSTNATSPLANSVTVSGGGATGATTTDSTIINQAPDLIISKTTSSTFVRGGTASYTLRVSNMGSGPSIGTISVTDTMPTGLTLTSAFGDNWNCTASTSTVMNCVNGTFFSPGSLLQTITLNVNIASDAPSSITNTARVDNALEVITTNNTGSVTNTVSGPPPDLTITKVAQGGPFQQGGTITYLLTVTNNGSGNSSGTITVTDIIPTGLTVTNATGPNWTCSGTSTISCSNATPIAPSTSSVITLSANIASNAPTSITNTVNVSGGGDSNTGNNAGSSVINVAQLSPELTITKVAQGGPFQQGGTITYLLTVTNNGNGNSVGSITVTDIIPTGLTVTNATGPNWTCSGTSTISCSNATPIAPSTSSVITLSANIASNAPTSITNTVNVSGGGDSNTGNNAGSSVINVAPIAPELTITKVAQGGPFQQGGTITYRLTVTNNGNGNSVGTITVTDIIPTGLTVTNATGVNWSCSGTATVTCSNATPIAPSTSSVITLSANIASNAPLSITNTVNVSGGGDSNTGNNAGSSVINVAPIAPELTITKVAQGGPFQQGGTVTYLLTVTNNGNGNSVGTITVTDIIPTGLAVTNATGTSWNCSGTATVTCSNATPIAPLASSVIALSANIASNSPLSITNTVNVSGGGDSNTGNNAASSLINVGAGLVNVTINVPAGITYTFNGQTVTGSQTFNVAPGNYNLSTTTPQILGAGIRAIWASWSDGGAISHSVTVGSTALTITGNFTTQFQLTTAASPSNGGAVTPATGFYDSGTVVNVSATPNSGFTFANWSGPVANANAASTTVTMNAATAITANFTSQTGVTINVPAGITYTFNGQTVTGSQTFNVAPGTYNLSTTSPQILGAGIRAVWASWSDGGAISHSVTVGSTALTITGNFTTQFQLTTAASPSNGGAVTPATGFYDSGTVVNVSATPNSGFTFTNWSGPVANTNAASTTVTMNAARSITANFAAPTIAPEITSQLSITRSTPSFNRLTGRFTQSVTITNNGSAIASAAFVLDSLASGFTMISPSGVTANTSPAGSPFRELGPLAAASTVTITVEFTRVGTPALTYTPRVLGPGLR